MLIGKQISFGQWKTWRASRQIDLERMADSLISKCTGPEKQDIDILIKTVETLKELKLIKSLGMRLSDNDTIDIINKQMKAKALRDIDKWENGNGD